MKKCESTLNWNDAPDTITPIHLAKILGCGNNTARNIFNAKDFPRIKYTGVKQIADKEMVHLWIKGVDTTSSANVMLNDIINILKRIEKSMEDLNGKEN